MKALTFIIQVGEERPDRTYTGTAAQIQFYALRLHLEKEKPVKVFEVKYTGPAEVDLVKEIASYE